MVKKIRVKQKRTKELFEFVCFSKISKDCFNYILHPGEELCETGYIGAFEPVGYTWEEVWELTKNDR